MGIEQLLSDNAALAAKTDASERAILKAAESRLSAVEEELSRIRKNALTDDAVADSYMRLVIERGHLNQVIEHSKMLLRRM